MSVVNDGMKIGTIFAASLSVPDPLQISGCVAGTGWQADDVTVLVNAAHGTWPKDGFCRVKLPLSLPTPATTYQFTTRLNTVQATPNGITHPGVMYNVQDLDNYDFVYFRYTKINLSAFNER